MHELALTCSIVETAASAAQGRPVARVTLVIGRLSGVMVEAVRFCFPEVARGTPLDGAALDIEEPAGRARCEHCDAEFSTPDLLTQCACGSYDVMLVAGEELLVRSIELKEAP